MAYATTVPLLMCQHSFVKFVGSTPINKADNAVSDGNTLMEENGS